MRWLAVLALALGGFAIGTTEFVAMGLLPDIASSLGITEPTAGHVISAYALGVVIGAPLIAALAARVPRKTLLLALMAVFTLGNLASVLAPSYGTLMIARFVAGLPHGAFFGVAALVGRALDGTAEPRQGRRARDVRADRGHRDRRADGVLAWPGAGLAQRVRARRGHRCRSR